MATKRKVNDLSMQVKSDAINDRESGPLTHADVVAKSSVSPSTLSTWFTKSSCTVL